MMCTTRWKLRWILAIALFVCSGCSDDSDLPASYRDLAVPRPLLSSAAARQRGRALFGEHCTLCHGERADGRGVRQQGFVRPPSDFTSRAWRRRATPRRVYFVIREGIRGTAMPSWSAFDEDQSWDLVAYVLSVSEIGP